LITDPISSRSLSRIDFATTWDGSNSEQLAVVMKYVAGVEILGFTLGSLEIRAEYVSQYEVARRKLALTQGPYNCCVSYQVIFFDMNVLIGYVSDQFFRMANAKIMEAFSVVIDGF
jgi:hypothetical protein